MSRNKNKKMIKKMKAVSITFAFYLLSIKFIHEAGKELVIHHQENKKIEALSDEVKESYLEELSFAIIENPTIHGELREKCNQEIRSLMASDVILLKKQEKKMAHRLRTIDFENFNKEDHQRALSVILFGHDDIFSQCVAASLTDYANEESESELGSLFGTLCYPISDEVLELLFINGEEGIKERLSEEYNVPVSKIEEMFDYLSYYEEKENEEDKKRIKSIFENECAKLLMNYFQEKEILDPLDQLLFASSIFEGNISFQHNIFRNHFLFILRDAEYGEYNRYFNKYTRLEESLFVYQQRLIKLIEDKGAKLDYEDTDARLLFYLYYLSYSNGSEEMLAIEDASLLSEKIIEEVFTDKEDNQLNKEFLYAYFSNGSLNIKEVTGQHFSLYSDPYSLALFFEYIQCLKEEVEDGNISKEKIDTYLAVDRTWASDEEFRKLYEDALEQEKSLFASFSILPNEYEPIEKAKSYFLEEK